MQGKNKNEELDNNLVEVSVDCVVFGVGKAGLQILLIEIGNEPLKGRWALPGDLVHPNEDLDASATRILMELTNLTDLPLEQVHAFGKVDRHPEKRVITIPYYAIVNVDDVLPKASNWAEKVQWHRICEIPDLTYDHNEIIDYSLTRMRIRLQQSTRRKPLWSAVLPAKFTLSQLQHFYELVMDTTYDKGNFRKKLNDMPYLKETNDFQKDVSHRPARLFRYDKKHHDNAV